jgi:hypothetical protein
MRSESQSWLTCVVEQLEPGLGVAAAEQQDDEDDDEDNDDHGDADEDLLQEEGLRGWQHFRHPAAETAEL